MRRKDLLLKISAVFCAVFAMAGIFTVIFSNIIIDKGDTVIYTARYVLTSVVLVGFIAFICAFRTPY